MPTPYPGPAASIGSAANGCLAGALPMAQAGPGWQVLHPSRNRFWGHPALISFLSEMAPQVRPWGTLLVGDLAQPRGGRMTSGHGSHQTGLDVDLMFRLAGEDGLDVEAPVLPSVVLPNASLDPALWGKSQEAVLRLFASDARVERIFVNPVIKDSLCRATSEAPWLAKLRPWWGHDEHFHVRLACPDGDASCIPGAALPEGTGCGAEVKSWIASGAWRSRPPRPAVPAPPPVPPAACRAILGG